MKGEMNGIIPAEMALVKETTAYSMVKILDIFVKKGEVAGNEFLGARIDQ